MPPCPPPRPPPAPPCRARPRRGSILLNFQNAPLSDVLNYLSDAAGFVIIQEVPVTGTVNLVSRQPINADEAVDLLNAVLAEKGYVAMRNGRILKIVTRRTRQKRDLPVDHRQRPRRHPAQGQHGDADPARALRAKSAKLVDNLRPLLSDNATITSNDSSNAIMLTDTQTNIHRIAEIVRALDTSISEHLDPPHLPAALRGFQGAGGHHHPAFLADAASNAATSTAARASGARRLSGGASAAAVGAAAAAAPAEPESEARQAASRVVAVADEQSNSVIVSAPDEFMTSIAEIVSKLDTSTNDITETQHLPPDLRRRHGTGQRS